MTFTTAASARLAAAPSNLAGSRVWDPWPVQDRAGAVVSVEGGELWVALLVDDEGHPEGRHDRARQHLLLVGGEVQDLGPLFPDGASPGSGEWSGSTVYDRKTGVLTAYYTAAGVRAEKTTTYTQRVMAAEGVLDLACVPSSLSWGEHRELVTETDPYLPSGVAEGRTWLSAFRDPGWFLDPCDGREYLLVAASVDDAEGQGPWAAVALAAGSGDVWSLEEPVIATVGTNRELERPHIIVREGLYYLFVSTQKHAFVTPADGPTGLYGYVAADVRGPYTPVNGDGLVLANPADRPHEAYAWLVSDDLRVAAFLNYPDEPAGSPRPGPEGTFVGGFAPWQHLHLSGGTASVIARSTQGASG